MFLKNLDTPGSNQETIIAFPKEYIELTGCIHTAIFLSQAKRWSEQMRSAKGWFFKSQKEWRNTTGLTRRQQQVSRKKLKSFSFWQEQTQGFPNTTWFRVDVEKLQETIQKTSSCTKVTNWTPNVQTVHQSDKLEPPVAPKWQTGVPDEENSKNLQLHQSDKLDRSTTNLNQWNSYIYINNKYNKQTEDSTTPPLNPPLSSETVWDPKRIRFYKLLFAFYGRCKNVLGLDLVKAEKEAPVEFPGRLNEALELEFRSFLRNYMKERGLSYEELKQHVLALGDYMGERKPFLLQKRTISLRELLKKKEDWLLPWMVEALVSMPKPIQKPSITQQIKESKEEHFTYEEWKKIQDNSKGLEKPPFENLFSSSELINHLSNSVSISPH